MVICLSRGMLLQQILSQATRSCFLCLAGNPVGLVWPRAHLLLAYRSDWFEQLGLNPPTTWCVTSTQVTSTQVTSHKHFYLSVSKTHYGWWGTYYPGCHVTAIIPSASMLATTMHSHWHHREEMVQLAYALSALPGWHTTLYDPARHDPTSGEDRGPGLNISWPGHNVSAWPDPTSTPTEAELLQERESHHA